jgi:exopolysaccharide production protein ExoZ
MTIDQPQSRPAAQSTAPAAPAGQNLVHRSKLDLLQVLRGAAASLVVLYHVNPIFKQNLGGRTFLGGHLDFGFSGVDLFFVLSGFVIMYVHSTDIGRPERLKRFAWRRFSRVYPLYWLVLGGKLLSEFLPFLGGDRSNVSAGELVRGLLLLPQRDAFSSENLLGVSWTLTFEVLFYAAFALLICTRRRWPRYVVGAWIALVVVSIQPFQSPANKSILFGLITFESRNILVEWITFPAITEFALGVGIAWLFAKRRLPNHRVLYAIGGVGFAASAILFDRGIITDVDRALTFGPAAALLVAACVAHEQARSIRAPRLLKALGDASYSIYLVHGFLINQMSRQVLKRFPDLLVGSGGRAAVGFAIIVATIGGGWLVHKLLEKPVLAVLQRRAVT